MEPNMSLTTFTAAVAAITGNPNIPYNTPDEVLNAMKADDRFAAALAGAEDPYAMALQYVGDFTAALSAQYNPFGSAAGSTPADPTKTQDEKRVVNEVKPDEAALRAANDIVASQREERMRVTQEAKVIAVLADRPYPGEWMNIQGTLPVKAANAASDIESKLKPNDTVTTLLATDGAFIPSNAQLAELQKLWVEKHQPGVKKDGTPKAERPKPAWVTEQFDNDAAVQKILSTINSQQGFAPFIPPQGADEGTGIAKEKAWRWNTKGYTISYPDKGQTVTTHFPKGELGSFLTLYTNGYIGDLGSATEINIRLVKATLKADPKQKPDAPIPSPYKARVRNAGPKNNPTVNVIKKAEGNSTSMTVRSRDFYLLCTVKNGAFTVRKQRINLTWATGPAFVAIPEYSAMVASTTTNSLNKQKAMQNAQQAMLNKLALEGGQSSMMAVTASLADRAQQTHDLMQGARDKAAQQAAADLSL